MRNAFVRWYGKVLDKLVRCFACSMVYQFSFPASTYTHHIIVKCIFTEANVTAIVPINSSPDYYCYCYYYHYKTPSNKEGGIKRD